MKRKSIILLISIILFANFLVSSGFSNTLKLNTNSLSTSAIINIMEKFYGKTTQPIVIYQKLAFENGTLVLSDNISDGEHYPDLHYIDRLGNITYITAGSFCWTLNYTNFKGYYIYYGLARFEANRYGNQNALATKISLLLSNRTVDVKPAQSPIAQLYPKEGNAKLPNTSEGYIIAVKGSEIPNDLIAETTQGKKISLLKTTIKQNNLYRPDYLNVKNISIYNSFAFSFSPMLKPEEWRKGFIDGFLTLHDNLNKTVNINTLNFRPSGQMKSSGTNAVTGTGNGSGKEPTILPQEVKPFYLCDSSNRLVTFSAGDTVQLEIPNNRKLIEVRFLRLTPSMVLKPVSSKSFFTVKTTLNKQLILPKNKGYHLIVLKTKQLNEIQTYTGMINLK